MNTHIYIYIYVYTYIHIYTNMYMYIEYKYITGYGSEIGQAFVAQPLKRCRPEQVTTHSNVPLLIHVCHDSSVCAMTYSYVL